MTFEQMKSASGLTARPFQADLTQLLCEKLAPGIPVSVALQAPTGVGKTWAASYPVLQAVREGRRVIWSTHTTLLRAQVHATLTQAVSVMWSASTARPAVSERRGRADYSSPSRTLRMRHALKERGADTQIVTLLDALANWGEPISDFVARYGELPVPQSLVCLTAACPADEQITYLAQRDAAADSALVVQTHALTLIEARFRRLIADLVVFDEADALTGVAAGSVEARLPLDDLERLAEIGAVDIAASLALLRARVTVESERIIWRDPTMAQEVRVIADKFHSAAGGVEPELAETLRDTAEDLAQFATVDLTKTGAALVQDVGAGPVLAVAAVDAAGWLGTALRDKQVVLMSATLGKHEEDDLAAACRRLGFWKVEQVHVSPPKFGIMEFRLADRAVPLPLTADGLPNPPFFDYAALMVQEAAQTGRTLVLCASYADVLELVQRLGTGVIAQQRGQPLMPLIERFRADPAGVLVTPAAWAGLDLPHMIDNVVIVRLPVPRPDELREAVLTAALEHRGRSAQDARNILASEARADTMRRLAQGMGRGVRAADDHCTIWIADPRFPLPANLIIDLRRRLTQGSAAGWHEMAQSIPLRFRRGGVRSSYGAAKIVSIRNSTSAAA
jgi:Rad3-related DNA helicase